MTVLGRRRFLGLSGAALAGVLGASGCSRTSQQEAVTTAGADVIRWWDHFQPLKPLYERMFAEYGKAHPGTRVEHVVYNPSEMGQALQLAFKSNQIADVHTVAGLGSSEAALVAGGWFSPLADPDAIRAKLPADSLLEGLHVFDGKLYTFPVFTPRQYTTLTWINRELVEKAGGDPDAGPATWDEFRALAARITKDGGGRAYGWIQGLQFQERMQTHVTELAMSAGAAFAIIPGAGEMGLVDPRTGDYPYASEPFVQALEFLLSLVRDKVVFPASTSLDARTARARWATGVAGMFFDGSWNIGVVNGQFKQFAGKVGVGPVPSPDGEPVLYGAPAQGQLFVSSKSRHVEAASELLARCTGPEFSRALAGYMDQVPLDLEAVATADVHPTYKRAVELFGRNVRLAPSPVSRNPAVTQVISEMKEQRPTLGEITQGILSGEITDIGKSLREHNGKLTAERERATRVVSGKGVRVSLDDWAFPNWKRGEDYTAEMYRQ
ncbi:multiple sugar transport system substrate-binding protein [Nonomuraea fuscirosea]|uniref:Multiple sugar transport system substrate-binding protein n=1 Tax=Nonomuraea fuscirosea TaxID=1291556 RepID=A0A2T0N3W8_9ACTN|nr:extracellular solute-binding protein [Nonomuraea fuscirosea]PRX66846.1 multiple sugar transport system substrate-binding protein [Nonomuraea fuscirosea]